MLSHQCNSIAIAHFIQHS